MKKQQDNQIILEDFKGAKNIPGIKSAKKRVLVTKIKNEKGEIITSPKGIANVFGEICKKKKKTTTMHKKKLNKKSVKKKMRAASLRMTTTPMR